MKIILPISDLINKDNLFDIPCDAYELRVQSDISLLDRIKTTNKPILWHDSIGCINYNFVSYFKNLMEKYGNEISLFSCSFAPNTQYYQIENYKYKSKNIDLLTYGELEDIFFNVVKQMKLIYKKDIAFENSPKYLADEYISICNPKTLYDFINNTNTNLVLDIAHAIISAHNIGVGVKKYIAELPLNRVIEIHISYPDYVNGQLFDCHEYPTNYEIDLLKWVLSQVRNDVYVAVEYYKDWDKLKSVYQLLTNIKEQ